MRADLMDAATAALFITGMVLLIGIYATVIDRWDRGQRKLYGCCPHCYYLTVYGACAGHEKPCRRCKDTGKALV